MIIFRIFDTKKGDLAPHTEPRSFYKAYLNHINCRRDHNTKVRISRRGVGKDTVITAHVSTLDEYLANVIDLDDLLKDFF